MQYLGTVSKTTEWSLSVSKQTVQQHSNPSLCPNHWCWRSQKWSVLWRPTRPSRTNTKKDVLFIIGDWNAKVESQDVLRVTGKFGLEVQNEAEQRLIVFPREHTGHSKYPFPTTQEMTLHMDIAITRLILKSNWLYYLQLKMEKLYTVSKNKTWNWLWLRSWMLYCKIQT